MKRCCKCKGEKPETKFSKDRASRDGFSARCKECDKKKQANYVASHPDECKESGKKYRNTHKKELAKAQALWVAENEEYNREYHKKYRSEHRADRCERNKEKYKTDLNFKLGLRLRARLGQAVSGWIKGGSAVRDLGCTIPELIAHLESKFYNHLQTQEPMSWENHGLFGWHIDHIKPLASFDLTDREQFLRACHYTNLQPLWAKDNLSKGDRI